MEQATATRRRITTTQHSYGSFEQLHKYIALYKSIGYKSLKGRRVPNGTKHKLLLKHDCFCYVLYHE